MTYRIRLRKIWISGLSALFAGTLLAATFTDQVQVNLVVSGGGSSTISINATNLVWNGIVIPGEMDFVNSAKMTCSFFPAAGPWTIVAYHTNLTGNALRSATESRQLLVRVWQPNYGPTNYYQMGYLPNPSDTNVWTISPVVGTPLAPGTFASQTKGDHTPIDFHFIVDARTAPSSTYSGVIFFELQVP